MTIDRQGTIRLVIILCGTIPFFFFLDKSWGHAALLGYSLTAFFFGLLLVPDYPSLGTSWFWKTMIPIVVAHLGIVFGLVWLDLRLPEINRMPRWLYGLATLILFLEDYVATRFIHALRPKVDLPS
jgi:hypothetical protein